jgi:hypothetical protein
VEVGDVPSSFVVELKNILRLYVALLPSFTDKQLADFTELFDNIDEELQTLLSVRPGNKPNAQTKRFMEQLFDLTREFAAYANSSLKEKKLAAAEILKRIFNVTPKGLRVPALSMTRVGSVDPLSRTMAAQDDEDDDDDDARRAIRASYEGNMGDAVAESFGVNPDVVRRAFSTANAQGLFP